MDHYGSGRYIRMSELGKLFDKTCIDFFRNKVHLHQYIHNISKTLPPLSPLSYE